MKNPQVIAITGASSGIGEALARHYAAPGVTLYLTARNEARLATVAKACGEKGASVQTSSIAVTEAEALASWLQEMDEARPIDLLIANAGISGGAGGGTIHGEQESQVRRILAVNVDGMMNTVLPMLPLMCARKRGQIALMSSLAGFRGLPSAPAYSASKAIARIYGEALRGRLGWEGVEVSVICPGYVATPLTQDNPFPMPFLMKPEKAAGIIARGLARNKPRIAFPWQLYLPMLFFSNFLPVRLTDPLFARLPAKPATGAASL